MPVTALHEEMTELSIARSSGLLSYVNIYDVNIVKKMCDTYGSFLSFFPISYMTSFSQGL